MGRVASIGKIEEWTKRLSRFAATDVTVARFCRREGVSAPAFYAWKKKLRQVASPAGASPRFLPVQITPPKSVSARRETVVRLGRTLQIEFGSDLLVVEAVVKQLLPATRDAQQAEDNAC
jgi:transposase-like protein